jgi:hypothetical protein
LDLEGVGFSAGVNFSFAAGASLAVGEIGILVRDPANYPAANILGTFTGALNNGGEQITLRDAAGENILSFEYDDKWFSPASGGGYSLEILDDTAVWDSWDLPESWALSCVVGGSPSMQNPTEHSTAFEEWARATFTAAELADPALSGADADPDGDGLTNFMVYALGGTELPSFGEHEGFPTLTYRAVEKAADLAYTVENSIDMESWLPVGTTVGLPVNNGDGTFSFTVRSDLPLTEERQFLRLSIDGSP